MGPLHPRLVLLPALVRRQPDDHPFREAVSTAGDLLIYYLEAHPTHPDAAVGAPVGVMEAVLGKPAAAKLLDFAGAEERPLLAHGMAVCAMTNTMQT